VACPYAEKKGAAVYCRAAGRKVNPLAFPCFTDRYEKCRYYKQARASEAPRREEEARPKRRLKGITKDLRQPRDCTECIYYGVRTGTCLLLKIPIPDPKNPPCAED